MDDEGGRRTDGDVLVQSSDSMLGEDVGACEGNAELGREGRGHDEVAGRLLQVRHRVAEIIRVRIGLNGSRRRSLLGDVVDTADIYFDHVPPVVGIAIGEG